MEGTFIASFDAMYERGGGGRIGIHRKLMLEIGHLSGHGIDCAE